VRAIAILGVALLLASCQQTMQEHSSPKCVDPANFLVTTGDDAMRIAYAFLLATHPHIQMDDEKKWSSDFTATLQGCIWKVDQKPKLPRNYSMFVMSIGAEDGRFLGILVSD
jgi:hypothetical protein